MFKYTIILLVSYFLQFYLTSLRGKNILPNLTNDQEPELVLFGPLEPQPEPLRKKTWSWSWSRLRKKSGSRSRLKKKSGAGAIKKLAGSQALNLRHQKDKSFAQAFLLFYTS